MSEERDLAHTDPRKYAALSPGTEWRWRMDRARACPTPIRNTTGILAYQPPLTRTCSVRSSGI